MNMTPEVILEGRAPMACKEFDVGAEYTELVGLYI